LSRPAHHRDLPSFPTRRSSDLSPLATGRPNAVAVHQAAGDARRMKRPLARRTSRRGRRPSGSAIIAATKYVSAYVPYMLFALNRSEEHTSELQSRSDIVCRLLL